MQDSFIDGCGLFLFSEAVSPEFKEDVLTATLYGQLAASFQHDKFGETQAWLHTYFSALNTFSCLIRSRDVQSVPLDINDSTWSYTATRLAKRVSPALLKRAESALKAIFKGSEASPVGKLLVAQTTQGLPLEEAPQPKSGQLIPALDDTQEKQLHNVVLLLGFIDSEPVVDMVILAFKTGLPVDEVPLSRLFEPGGNIGNLEIAVVAAELDQHGFGYLRKDLMAKLGARRDQFIVELRED
ncbi:MAG TPA: hypothetical protein VF682_19700 [Pseudomonas sp.]|jgi:hypothetical protein